MSPELSFRWTADARFHRGTGAMKYEIVKHVDFCFGHRLIDYDGKCNQPHGHNGRVEIRLAADELDELGMVADFRDVRHAVGGWIDAHIDHRMVLRRDDPLIGAIEALGQQVFEMDENPTTENMARLLYDKVAELGFPVVSLTLWETPDSHATYTPERIPLAADNGAAALRQASS